MRHKMIRWAAIIICVLAAGICYSCSWDPDAGQEKILLAPAPESESKQEASEFFEELPESPEPGTDVSAEETEKEAETSQTRSICYVHVCGEVNSPGVYELEEGSRIYQAVEMAGGFTALAASEFLNMAQTVSDGMKIVVPDRDSLEGPLVYGGGVMAPGTACAGVQLPGPDGVMPGDGASGDSGAAKVNLNTATKEQLMTLNGIGEARAGDILRYREERGGFKRIEDIMKVSGIKDAAFQRIKDDITV